MLPAVLSFSPFFVAVQIKFYLQGPATSHRLPEACLGCPNPLPQVYPGNSHVPCPAADTPPFNRHHRPHQAQIFCWGREEVIRILWVAILLKERYEHVGQGLVDRQERNGKQRPPTKASDRGSQDRRLLSLPLRGRKASLLSSSLCVSAPSVICIQLSTCHMHLAPYQLLNFHCT